MLDRLIQIIRQQHNHRRGEGTCGYREYHGHAGSACDDVGYCADAGYRQECCCRSDAHAVIEALLQPTPEMVTAAVAPYRYANTTQFDEIMRAVVIGYWRAMLRSIRQPQGDGDEHEHR